MGTSKARAHWTSMRWGQWVLGGICGGFTKQLGQSTTAVNEASGVQPQSVSPRDAPFPRICWGLQASERPWRLNMLLKTNVLPSCWRDNTSTSAFPGWAGEASGSETSSAGWRAAGSACILFFISPCFPSLQGPQTSQDKLGGSALNFSISTEIRDKF